MVQGAAAEFFKTWAVDGPSPVGAVRRHIVLCLHDELLVHCRADRSDDAAEIVADGVHEAGHRWSGDGRVRFVADISVIRRWSDVK